MHFRRLYVFGILMLSSLSASALPPCVSVEYVVFSLLGNYEFDHGSLPYSPKGPTEALQRLKEYLDIHMSGGFYSHVAHGGNRIYFREKLSVQYPFLSDSPSNKFDYLNERNMSLQTNDSTIILVSNDYSDTLRLRCLTKGGQFFSLALKPKARTALPGIVGRSVRELVPYTAKVLDVQVFDPLQAVYDRKGGKSFEDWAKSKLRTDFAMPFHEIPDVRMHEFQMRRIVQAFIRYQLDNGALPYDSRGPAYALYKLRSFLPQESDGQELPKPLKFDENIEAAVDLDYLYRNQKSLKIGSDSERHGVIILAEARAWLPVNTNDALGLFCDSRVKGEIKDSGTSILYAFVPEGTLEIMSVDSSYDSIESLEGGMTSLYSSDFGVPFTSN